MALLLQACATDVETRMPSRLLFLEAEALENQELYSEAITKYERIIQENPGSRLATFSHLKLAEINTKQSDWDNAETNYRAFLNLNGNTFFTPYVLAKLLRVNHERSFTGLFFPAQEFDRDMEPSRRIILEYKRFFLLYPKSIYLDDVTPYYRSARDSLAEYEQLVGDYYFGKGQFNAAIGRYSHLLKTFPEFPGTREVLRKLIQAYRENRQPGLAQEMERIDRFRFDGAQEGDLGAPQGLPNSDGGNTPPRPGSP